jgi:hypothetical protein
MSCEIENRRTITFREAMTGLKKTFDKKIKSTHREAKMG